MSSEINNIHPERCPLCNEPNECGVAKGKGVCWCFAEKALPTEALSFLPSDAIDIACVCQVCAEELRRRVDSNDT